MWSFFLLVFVFSRFEVLSFLMLCYNSAYRVYACFILPVPCRMLQVSRNTYHSFHTFLLTCSLWWHCSNPWWHIAKTNSGNLSSCRNFLSFLICHDFLKVFILKKYFVAQHQAKPRWYRFKVAYCTLDHCLDASFANHLGVFLNK